MSLDLTLPSGRHVAQTAASRDNKPIPNDNGFTDCEIMV